MTGSAAAIPLYEQVRLYLREQLRSRYRPGDLLPTQHEIADQTGASIITVKRAFHELAREGLVESIRGKGTIVRQVEVTDLHTGVSSWTESVSGLGETPHTAWTRISQRRPDSTTRNLLRLRPSAQTTQIRRLRTVRGQPVCLMTNELPSALLPGFSKDHLDSESLYDCLHRHFKLWPAEAEEEVTARKVTAAERKHLGRDCAIVVQVNRRTTLIDGRPLELATIVAHADHYRYRLQLHNNPLQQ